MIEATVKRGDDVILHRVYEDPTLSLDEATQRIGEYVVREGLFEAADRIYARHVEGEAA